MSVRARVTTSRAAWLSERAKTLGGSEVPDLFGQGYKGLLRIQQEKLGLLEPEPGSRRLQMGLVAEPVILEFASEALGSPVLRPGPNPVLYTNSGIPNLHVTPDGFAVEEPPKKVFAASLHQRAHAVVSLKTVSMAMKREWAESPSAYALLQLQTEMLVTGIEQGYIAACFGLAEEERLYGPFAPQKKIQQMILERVGSFWTKHILNREPVSAAADDASILKELYPKAEPGKIVILTGPEWVEAVARIEVLKAKTKEYEEGIKASENLLKQQLADAEYGYLNNEVSVSWKNRTRKAETKPRPASEYRQFEVVKTPPEVQKIVEAQMLEAPPPKPAPVDPWKNAISQQRPIHTS